mmetsp:Transcript_123280/g.348352  ORF Transcript_123280/g.348352 Transcript_123280/m.348352 type:complete len:528 (+) Transcript_123280:129-1712(+)
MLGVRFLLGLCLPCSLVAATPNILFLMMDQHRHDALGSGAHTPNLDSLAADGAQFVVHYTSTPTCTPARAAILTGRSPWRHGMLGYNVAVAPHYPRELPVMMAASGLMTAVVGKDHFGWDAKTNRPVAHGFETLQIYDGLGTGFKGSVEFDDYDQWFQKQRPGQDPLKSGGVGWNDWVGTVYAYEEWLHPTAWTGRLAVERLKEMAASGKPFFLKVSFHRPHAPNDPPERFLNATPSPKRPPARSEDGWDTKFRTCPHHHRHYSCCGEVLADQLDFTRRAYLANVAFVDEQIGLILQALETSGAKENTFILYTSDHGDMRNDHYLWRKSFPYEGSAKIPLIVRWPRSLDSALGSQRDITVEAVTELRDIFPTFLDVVGQWNSTVEGEFDGRPLTWLLRGGGKKWRSWIDMEHNVYCGGQMDNHWNALTDGHVKYIFHASDASETFFNLTADPQETRDLAADNRYEEAIKLWRGRMVQQFETEGRGGVWVKDGKLMRRKPCGFSPNWPGEGRGTCWKEEPTATEALVV